MTPTPEFTKLARNFHQDIALHAPSQEAVIEFLTRGLAAREKRDLEAFLDRLLSGDATDADLEALWSKSPAEFFVPEDHIRSFLSSIRSALSLSNLAQ